MKIFDTTESWMLFREQIPAKSSLGFAPTMGNLHKGHISLFHKSQSENDLTATSLFINPTQFNNPDDFIHYPRTLEQDLTLLEEAGVDYCLLPTQDAMYPDAYRYQITETDLSLELEGKHRPGHFTGVLTVVMKLLNLIRPERAYFGEKDYQQFLLIRDMAKAFFMPVDIQVCPTIREPSGLAYSSRNNRLDPEMRLQAEQFAQIFHQNKPSEQLKEELISSGIQVDYLETAHGRKFAAVQVGSVRLIDNVTVST